LLREIRLRIRQEEFDFRVGAARDFYASFLGKGISFFPHPVSKQSIMALVGAGFGITLAAKSQSEVTFPCVVYKPIAEHDAWVQVELAWLHTR